MGDLFACTERGIRDAISKGGGPHTFSCDGPQTVVTGAEIIIDNDVILDGEGNLTLDGNEDHRVFSVPEGVTAGLQGFGVIRGAQTGGGIYNIGVLTIADSLVSENTGPICGGGIDNDGTLTLTNSTVSGNAAVDCGGGIFNEGELTMTNSTVTGNSAPVGDALSVGPPREDRAGITTIANTLLVGDCDLGQPLTSRGGNIESPGDTCGFDQEGDQSGVSADDLDLGPLADNGGGPETHALLPGSVAIDRIPEVDCVDAEGAPLTTDQRGEPRPETGGAMCDVGAFERQLDDP